MDAINNAHNFCGFAIVTMTSRLGLVQEKLDKITKYDLDNVAVAHTDMENRKTSGSIVLKI